MEYIKCVDCGEVKPITEFYTDRTKSSGHKSYCKECSSSGTHQSNEQRSLAVDHDHRTGKVRALLCHKCNAALGNVNDSIDILKEMISYIDKHSS